MYDLIIVGAGAAGLNAGLYAARYKLKTLIISERFGGTGLDAPHIENWLGIRKEIGSELMKAFIEHVRSVGAEFLQATVETIKKDEKGFKVIAGGKEYEAKTIIFSTGMTHKKLDVFDKFEKKGVSYCVSCDGPIFQNKNVAVVGGGNSACAAAMMLSNYAKKVYMIVRKKELRAEPRLAENTVKNKKIEIIFKANITKAKGDKFLKSIELDNKNELEVQGVFVEIGLAPVTRLASEIGLKLDKQGFIKVNKDQETSVDGIFAAGDATDKHKLKQLITSAEEGAVAAFSAYQLLKEKK